MAALLDRLPIPTAFSWFQGLDWVMYDSEVGESTPNLYLFGELRDPLKREYFTGYYFLVSLFKIPLASWLIFAWALWLLARERRAGD